MKTITTIEQLADTPIVAQRLEITFVIPDPWWTSSNSRLHWRRKQERTRWLRQFAAARARNARLPKNLATPVRVTAFISYPRGCNADPNNAEPVTKALIDGLTDHGCWPDDNHKHVIGPHHQWGGVTPGKRTVRLVIEGVTQ